MYFVERVTELEKHYQEKERMNGKINNNLKYILIVFFFLFSFTYSKVQEARIKNEIRKDIISGLLVNILYDNAVNGEYQNLSTDIDYILLDYNRLFLINTYFTYDTIEYNGESYTVIKYQFKYINSSDQDSWNDSTIGPESSIKQLMSSVTYTPKQYYDYEKYKLFENGLYFQSLKTKELKKMSMDNDCYTDLESLSIEKFQKEIVYRFYHYLPEEINIDFSNSSFSFFSKVLKRYFSGKIVYNQLSYRYQLKLSNGLLK